MNDYSVIVGNIGRVYDGNSKREADRAFKEYRDQSKEGYGRASHRTVTLMKNGEPAKEFRPKLTTPHIDVLASLLTSIKRHIDDDMIEEKGDKPSIQITIGCSYGSWSYQTGDNSYTGGAYGHPFWGVGYLYRNTNCRELARELINDALNQQY